MPGAPLAAVSLRGRPLVGGALKTQSGAIQRPLWLVGEKTTSNPISLKTRDEAPFW